jgi:hypothetical protein
MVLLKIHITFTTLFYNFVLLEIAQQSYEVLSWIRNELKAVL